MPLDALADQSIALILAVGSAGGAGDDGVYFANGRIVRPAQP